MQIDKVIVTNVTALRGKYGAKYVQVSAALAALKASDAARGLKSRLVAIDSPADMKAAGGVAVGSAADERGAKAAIDAVYRKYRPDYLMILGAPDVVPHIHLTNPMHGTPDDDGDPNVPSDLPYACEAPFARIPLRFIGPTRVVGRLPDEKGASSPEFLVKLLRTAAGHLCRDKSDYTGHFALSAKVWEKSTRLSAETLFGPGSAVLTSPPGGPAWSKAQLAPRVHFINCHGDTISSKFFGEFPKGKFFDAHDSARLPGRVTAGSVIAAECCYGAELYDPADADGARGISSTYLAEGAYGFFGSSNIAYGPSEGNGQADLICRFFLEAVLSGGSLGRAAVEARQKYVAQYSHLDPSDLKTAVQFNLLGDPSIHAVKHVSHAFSKTAAIKGARQSGAISDGARAFRRERINRTGHNLAHTVGAAHVANVRPPPAVKRLLEATARESGLTATTWRSYRVRFPAEAARGSSAHTRTSRRERTIHVVQGPVGGEGLLRRPQMTAIIATLEHGKMVHIRRVHSR
jgi:Peptidase family C25